MSAVLRGAVAWAVRQAGANQRNHPPDDPRRPGRGGAGASGGAWVRDDSRAVAERAGVPYAEVADVAAVAEALGSAVDLIVVCAEPTRHARLAAALLEAGLDVLVDKPVATTLADADHLVAVAARTGRPCAVVHRT
ncbi:MAG: Gfo/Idh/MocA family oxidoreductase, partial [Cellulosimicrobium funkei]